MRAILSSFSFNPEQHSLSGLKGMAKNAAFVSYGNAVGFSVLP
jgi:hypothetical protein